MTKELRELLASLNKAQRDATALVNDEKAPLDEIQAKTDEIKGLKAKIEALKEAESEEKEEAEAKAEKYKPKDGAEKFEYNTKVFYDALRGKLDNETRAIVNRINRDAFASLSVGSKEDGGYTVPDDLTKEILESMKVEESVRNLVRVESVNTMQGQRTVRVGTPMRLWNTEEREEIKMLNNPQFDIINYKIHKYAGLMDVSSELLDDSFLNFKEEMKRWLSDSSRETENDKILYGMGGNDPVGILFEDADVPFYKEIAMDDSTVVDIAFLRRIKNTLNSAYRKNAKWVMNTQAQEALAGLKDANGREILVPDPRQNDTLTIFGRPVEIYDIVKTDEDKTTVIMFGDFDKAYRMFDRKAFSIKLTDVGAGSFETDKWTARGIERFDGQRIDPEALVIVRDFPVLG